MVDKILVEVRDGWIKMNEVVRGMFGPNITIDEMALIFPSVSVLASWVRRLVARPGYELFNVAHDTVKASPIPAKYEVEYWFLRTPFDYRLELMAVNNGYSPIHSAIQLVPNADSLDIVVPVHASFKVADSMAYASANRTLQREGWECAQKCDSSYGLFSYWMLNPDEEDGWFLKPRVNLRDRTGGLDA